MKFKGAGGSKGGSKRFFLGLIMMVAGSYLFLDAIKIINHLGLHSVIYSYGSFNLTAEMVLIPLILGLGFIFYHSKNPIGWILSTASIIILAFEVFSSVKFQPRRMSAFELIMMLVLMIGGLGLFLSSLQDFEKKG